VKKKPPSVVETSVGNWEKRRLSCINAMLADQKKNVGVVGG